MSFQTAIKYPTGLTKPPHEKWIMFEARSGRHIARDGKVFEASGVDSTLATVALYLPTDALKSSMTVNYKDIDLGMAAGKAIERAAQSGALRAPTSGGPGMNIDHLKQQVNPILEASRDALIGAGVHTALAVLEGIGRTATVDDPRGVIEVIAGGAVNPRTDTAFDAMQYRTHEFTFNLIPRDKEEADNIDKILNILHFYSLPSYGDNTSMWNFMIGYPYEFVITMFNQTHLNKIERSVLTGLTVDHAGGDRIAFARDRENRTDYYPAATTLTLSFKEVRLLGRDSKVIFRGDPGRGARPPGIGLDPREGALDNELTGEPTTVYQDQFDAQRGRAGPPFSEEMTQRIADDIGMHIPSRGR